MKVRMYGINNGKTAANTSNSKENMRFRKKQSLNRERKTAGKQKGIVVNNADCTRL